MRYIVTSVARGGQQRMRLGEDREIWEAGSVSAGGGFNAFKKCLMMFRGPGEREPRRTHGIIPMRRSWSTSSIVLWRTDRRS